MNIQAFPITLAQHTLDDLRERLARTRWPDEVEGAGWDHGTNVAYLKELVDYWQYTFDWRAQEAKLNAFPQFRPTSMASISTSSMSGRNVRVRSR